VVQKQNHGVRHQHLCVDGTKQFNNQIGINGSTYSHKKCAVAGLTKEYYKTDGEYIMLFPEASFYSKAYPVKTQK